MKLNIKKDYLVIVPENEQDEAYLRDTLGISSENPEVKFTVEKVTTSIGFGLKASSSIYKILPVDSFTIDEGEEGGKRKKFDFCFHEEEGD